MHRILLSTNFSHAFPDVRYYNHLQGGISTSNTNIWGNIEQLKAMSIYDCKHKTSLLRNSNTTNENEIGNDDEDRESEDCLSCYNEQVARAWKDEGECKSEFGDEVFPS